MENNKSLIIGIALVGVIVYLWLNTTTTNEVVEEVNADVDADLTDVISNQSMECGGISTNSSSTSKKDDSQLGKTLTIVR